MEVYSVGSVPLYFWLYVSFQYYTKQNGDYVNKDILIKLYTFLFISWASFHIDTYSFTLFSKYCIEF